MEPIGAFQSFYKPADVKGKPNLTTGNLSAETKNQLVFPYHTFIILDVSVGHIVKQHTLILNPQEVNQREPVRAQTIQTIGGAYTDDFGRGLPRVTIAGNTGWRLKHMPDGKGLLDGWQAFKALRSDIFRFFTDSRDSVRTYLRNPDYELRWYNWGEDEYYAIQPEEFELQRSAANPLLYQYNLAFTCIRDLRAGFKGKNMPYIFKMGTTTSISDALGAIGPSVSNLGQLAKFMA